MNITVFIEPHERFEALQAYSARLSDVQRDQIEDAPETAIIRLQLWPGKSNVTIIEEG